jgi:hypothetical protein
MSPPTRITLLEFSVLGQCQQPSRSPFHPAPTPYHQRACGSSYHMYRCRPCHHKHPGPHFTLSSVAAYGACGRVCNDGCGTCIVQHQLSSHERRGHDRFGFSELRVALLVLHGKGIVLCTRPKLESMSTRRVGAFACEVEHVPASMSPPARHIPVVGARSHVWACWWKSLTADIACQRDFHIFPLAMFCIACPRCQLRIIAS